MARKKLLSEGEIRQFMKLANLRPISKVRLSEYGMHPGARDEEVEAELGATEDELGAEDELADDEGDELAMADDELAMDDAAGGEMVSMEDFMSALERAIEEVTGEEADVSEEPGEEEEVDMEMDMEMGPEGGEEVELGAEEEMMQEIIRRLMERQKYGGNRGDIPDDDRDDEGHHGRGGKNRETAKEEGEEDFKEGMTDNVHGDRPRAGRKQRKAKRPEDDGPVGAIMTGDDSEVLPDDGSDDAPVRRGRGSHRTNEEVVNEVARRVAARLQAQNRKEQMVDHLAERIMKRLTK